MATPRYLSTVYAHIVLALASYARRTYVRAGWPAHASFDVCTSNDVKVTKPLAKQPRTLAHHCFGDRPILCCSFGDFCVWCVFRIFEHDEDKLEIRRKNQYGNITTSNLTYVIEDS